MRFSATSVISYCFSQELIYITIFTKAIAHHPRALRENSNILTNPMLIVIVFERDQMWKIFSWKVVIPLVTLLQMVEYINVCVQR